MTALWSDLLRPLLTGNSNSLTKKRIHAVH